MKKRIQVFIVVLLAVVMCGCNSLELRGVDSFNENDCCFGLNDGLLPGDRDFLSNYVYDNGNYYYWRNNFGPAQAKTFVILQYSQNAFNQAKAACLDYYSLSEPYCYDGYTFHAVNISGGEVHTTFAYPGLRLFGYNESACTLVFAGYLNETKGEQSLSESSFTEFISENFANFFSSTTNH